MANQRWMMQTYLPKWDIGTAKLQNGKKEKWQNGKMARLLAIQKAC